MIVFVDTGAFCAFTDRSDRLHAAAVRQFATLLKERAPFVVTNFIIDETYTWLRYRLGHSPACEFLERLRERERLGLVDVVIVTRPLEDKAEVLLRKYSDQDLSYTDGTSLALIEEARIKRAFAFDKHFHLAGVEIVPGIVR